MTYKIVTMNFNLFETETWHVKILYLVMNFFKCQQGHKLFNAMQNWNDVKLKCFTHLGQYPPMHLRLRNLNVVWLQKSICAVIADIFKFLKSNWA